MNTWNVWNIFSSRRPGACLSLVCAIVLVCAGAGSAHAGDFDEDSAPAPTQGHTPEHRHRQHDGNDIVSIGHDSTLAAGGHADAVVSVLGSSTSSGDAVDVVSVLGDTRVTGPASNSAVAVLGDTYVDSKVGDAVAVLGNVELGPHAEVDGAVVAVLGQVRRDPAAIVHGGVHDIGGGDFSAAGWLRSWIHYCLFYGRPLAPIAGIDWAWGLALGFLALYLLLAVLFRPALDRCVLTLEHEPGHAALTALVTFLLMPVVVVLLFITLVGIAAVPFVAAALFCAGLLGKTVMLAWLGLRLTGRRLGPGSHPAIAVALGGALVLVLYLVPVLGFLVYLLLGFMGTGAVLYTLIAGLRAHRLDEASRPATPTSAAAATPPPGIVAAGPAPLVTAALPRAGFWIRMAALFIDLVLIGVVLRLLHPLGHFHLVLLAAYGAVMWKVRGWTVGGMVFGLHVVRLDGRPVDWETAIVRALGCFLSMAVVGLGFFWIAFDDAKQAWHDKIAGTVVVRAARS